MLSNGRLILLHDNHVAIACKDSLQRFFYGKSPSISVAMIFHPLTTISLMILSRTLLKGGNSRQPCSRLPLKNAPIANRRGSSFYELLECQFQTSRQLCTAIMSFMYHFFISYMYYFDSIQVFVKLATVPLLFRWLLHKKTPQSKSLTIFILWDFLPNPSLDIYIP